MHFFEQKESQAIRKSKIENKKTHGLYLSTRFEGNPVHRCERKRVFDGWILRIRLRVAKGGGRKLAGSDFFMLHVCVHAYLSSMIDRKTKHSVSRELERGKKSKAKKHSFSDIWSRKLDLETVSLVPPNSDKHITPYEAKKINLNAYLRSGETEEKQQNFKLELQENGACDTRFFFMRVKSQQ